MGSTRGKYHYRASGKTPPGARNRARRLAWMARSVEGVEADIVMDPDRRRPVPALPSRPRAASSPSITAPSCWLVVGQTKQCRE